MGRNKQQQCAICTKWMRSDHLARHMQRADHQNHVKIPKDVKILKDLLDLPDKQLEEVLQAGHDIQQERDARRQRVVKTVRNLELSAPEEVQHSKLIDDSCVRQRLINSNKVYLERLRLGETISNILDEGVIREESLAKEDKQALELYRHEQLRLDINEIILTDNGL